MRLRIFYPDSVKNYKRKIHVEFNPFTCMKKYHVNNQYKYEIPEFSHFIDLSTGHTYKNIEKITISDDDLIPNKITFRQKAKSQSDNFLSSLFCDDYEIKMPSKYSKVMKKLTSEECDFICFVKRNNKEIREKYPNFPTCDKINETINGKKIDKNILVLTLLKNYFLKTKGLEETKFLKTERF